MIPLRSVIIDSRVLIVNPLDSSVKFESCNFIMQKMTRNLKMHVLIRENDVDYVKKRFESQFIFDKKLKFENEVVVSDNGNMNF